jgi:hypothetical protein
MDDVFELCISQIIMPGIPIDAMVLLQRQPTVDGYLVEWKLSACPRLDGRDWIPKVSNFKFRLRRTFCFPVEIETICTKLRTLICWP